MENFTKKETLGLLKRGLERRVGGSQGAIDARMQNIETIDKHRKEITDRIEKYKDDEYTAKVFNAQLSEFDRQYNGERQKFLMSIEELEKTKPQAKKALEMIELIENGKSGEVNSKTLLLLIADLFFAPLIQDWFEFEESQKVKDGTDNNDSK